MNLSDSKNVSVIQKGVKVVPVILSGGVGSRLWPLSRENHPKPFICLEDGQSLIQKTYLRAISIPNIHEILTVTNRELFFYTKDAYEHIKINDVPTSFILEPFGRNSAPASAMAAHYVEQNYGTDTVLLILPADHIIEKNEGFLEAIEKAIYLAQKDRFVTFGILPTSPKTEYGYIEVQNNKVLRFIEKPDLETAKKYLGTNHFFWNSGMFCFSAGTLLKEMQIHCPQIVEQAKICMKNAHSYGGKKCVQNEIKAEDFVSMKDISIDYAISEKTKILEVVIADMGWSDIGSWTEFCNIYPPDDAGNHICGETVLDDVNDCIIHAQDKIVAGIGLKHLIIADTKDALLVADRCRSQDVRTIFKRLKDKNHDAYKVFPTVYRPWGSYTVLQEGERFKVKIIDVKPGASLSLQMHYHRSEHWVVVSGIAKVTNGEEQIILKPNQSTYIPIGNKHRLENHENEPLVIVEVQCGDYVGEDDIVRFEDVYSR